MLQTILFTPRQDQRTLRTTLSRADHPELWLLTEPGKRRRIRPFSALRMMSEDLFEFGGTAQRIRWIRPLKLTPTWRDCYRTNGSVTLEPSLTWGSK